MYISVFLRSRLVTSSFSLEKLKHREECLYQKTYCIVRLPELGEDSSFQKASFQCFHTVINFKMSSITYTCTKLQISIPSILFHLIVRTIWPGSNVYNKSKIIRCKLAKRLWYKTWCRQQDYHSNRNRSQLAKSTKKLWVFAISEVLNFDYTGT